MAIFYISAVVDGESLVYAMNATQNMGDVEKGSLSKHKLEDGSSASDNYVSDPEVISLSGKISDVFVGNSIAEEDRKSTKEYIEGLKKIKRDSIPFTTHFSSDLSPAYPCFFISLGISQDATHGFVGTRPDGSSVNSYRVEMQIQVTRIGVLSTIEVGRASEFVDPTQPKTSSSRATKVVATDLEAAYYQSHSGILQQIDVIVDE